MTQASVHIDRPFLDLKLTRDKAGARHVNLYLLLGAGPTWSGPPAILDRNRSQGGEYEHDRDAWDGKNRKTRDLTENARAGSQGYS